VGAAAGAASLGTLASPTILALAAFFTLPANLIVYGVNDIFDYETDVLNARKAGYESRVPPDRRAAVATGIAVCTIPFLALLPQLSTPALWALAWFALLAVQYSAPPLRTKARPGLDAATNALYVFPGIVGYHAAGGTGFPAWAFAAGWAWCMAMHAYSAVPDIAADTRAGIATTATWLGAERTLMACMVLWTVAAALATAILPALLCAALLIPYLAMGARSYARRRDAAALHGLYARFPLLNALVGMALFFAAASHLA